MSLEVKRYPSKGPTYNTLTACPVCEYELSSGESRWRHFLDEHDPEDFGLGGERSVE